MNEGLDLALQKLKSYIFDDPSVQEYLKLKDIIYNDPNLIEMRNKIKYLKKCDINEEQKKEYLELIQEYNRSPLIVQFKNVSEDVYNLLNEIKKEIES